MKTQSMRRVWTLAAAVALAAGSHSAFAGPTTFGTLSNFDAVNDTGAPCNGFEIELDGVTPGQIVYTFGGTYNRYGDPVISDTGTGGTYVRYVSKYVAGSWATSTPFATTPITTGGHQFWSGGDPNYPAGVPGDHFGIALNGNPTNTIYRWLVGDSSSPGNLVAIGSTVKIPAPVWTVQPNPNPVLPPAVQAVAPAPPKEDPNKLFGDAIWVKVFYMESAAKAELDQLLVGRAVPDASEVETEWQLLQAGKGVGFEDEDSGPKDLGAASESVTRRYEYYKYIGSYDVDGEALDEVAVQAPDPNPTVGDFIGGQNAALNLAAFDIPIAGIPEPGSLALLGLGALSLVRYRRRGR